MGAKKEGKKGTAKDAAKRTPFRQLLRCPPGPVDLSEFDTKATPGAPGGKSTTRKAMAGLGERVAELQEQLYACAQAEGDQRSVLLVLQGMDTSGKGGVVKHVVGELNPYGCQVKSFKAPTKEELSHDFLWRIRRALPQPGHLGVFDRSHYEDVLIARVRELVPPRVWARRYGTINRFEERLASDDCTIVKCFLHISSEKQKDRLMARLEDPAKHWKYNSQDVEERLLWDDYQQAYAAALEKCNTEAAPWYVIPSDRKWYRNYAVMMLLMEACEGLDPHWPHGDFDLKSEKARVGNS